jgi:hypothetical protein
MSIQFTGDSFMKPKIILLGALTLFASSPSNAALIGDFRLDNNLINLAGGPLALTNNGGSLGATGITFGAGQGPSIAGFSNTSIYSIEVAFYLDNLSSFRRLLDFKNKTTDKGLYSFKSFTNFFPVATSAQADFTVGQQAVLVLTRDGPGQTIAYVNGNQTISFADGPGDATIPSVLHFFNDDLVFPGEESSGYVDYIRIYDNPLTPREVSELNVPGIVPEPASWALMFAGFGLTGMAMRKRARVRQVLA